ncbi:MAG: phosphoribosylglycinamide formyltransferase [Deltaproteobacteria bacterium]|nr:phosphoribosylglycinamide formyltransferase [Deltaproteobacteria bacterium]
MTHPRVAILISGRGSNMTAILDAAAREDWPCTFALVLSNNADARGLITAAERGISTVVCDHRPYGRARRPEYDAELVRTLQEHAIDWIVLAGFMRILSPVFTRAFPRRILNIHPSLLPRFPGLRTHERALEAGVADHGCSVHLVDESLDGGPLLGQARVPVLPADTPESLAARVLVQEHILYPAVVRAVVSGDLPRLLSEPAGASLDQP